MMFIPDYHSQFIYGYQFVFGQFRRVIKMFKNNGSYLKRDRVGLQVENHDLKTLVLLIAQRVQNLSSILSYFFEGISRSLTVPKKVSYTLKKFRLVSQRFS